MQKCLVIQTAFLGDVILATPVLEALNQLHPHAVVDMLVRKGNEGLLTNNPNIRKTLVWDKKSEKYRDWWRLVQTVRNEHYDTVINIQRFGAMGLLTALSGAEAKIGFDKSPFSQFFSERHSHYLGKAQDSPHEVDRNLALIPGYQNKTRLRPSLYPGNSDYEAIQQYTQKEFICLAPASVWFTKQFPKDQWLALLNQGKFNDFPIILVGGPNDQAFCEKVKRETKHTHVTNLAGQLTYLQTAALIDKAKMLYSNDSAPLHMGSAMNTPTTAIFCSTIPEFGFGPLSDQAYVAQVEGLYCRPCTTHGKKACPEGHFRCAYDIDLDKLKDPLGKIP